MSWVFLVIGLLGGFGLSVIFWWITNHYLVPDIQFSEEVSRSDVGFLNSGVRHQIAIKNCGNRDAYNVKFRVRMKIKDILQNGGTLWDYMDIVVSDTEYFVLKKGIMFRVTPVAHRTSGFSQAVFPSNIRQRYKEENLTLDDLFDQYEEIRIFMEVIATDRFSEGAKYFRSKEYSKHDIRNGVFRGNNHLSIHKQTKPSARGDS